MQEVITRDEARAKSLKYYFTGKPCKNGGIGNRRVVNKQCRCDLCTAIDAERLRNYKENNRKLLSEKSREYHKKNKEALLARMKVYRQENKQVIYERKLKCIANNPEIYSQHKRKWSSENREKIKTKRLRWIDNNPEKIAEIWANRRAAKRKRKAMWYGEFDSFVFSESYLLAADREKVTGVAHHVDHMIPLFGKKASGLHCGLNLQVIPANLNQWKLNRMVLTEPDEWLSHLA